MMKSLLVYFGAVAGVIASVQPANQFQKTLDWSQHMDTCQECSADKPIQGWHIGNGKHLSDIEKLYVLDSPMTETIVDSGVVDTSGQFGRDINWVQCDQDYFIIGFKVNRAQGSQTNLRSIDGVVCAQFANQQGQKLRWDQNSMKKLWRNRDDVNVDLRCEPDSAIVTIERHNDCDDIQCLHIYCAKIVQDDQVTKPPEVRETPDQPDETTNIVPATPDRTDVTPPDRVPDTVQPEGGSRPPRQVQPPAQVKPKETVDEHKRTEPVRVTPPHTDLLPPIDPCPER